MIVVGDLSNEQLNLIANACFPININDIHYYVNIYLFFPLCISAISMSLDLQVNRNIKMQTTDYISNVAWLSYPDFGTYEYAFL